MWWTKNKDRDKYQAFYTSRSWRKAREYVLSQQPLCPDCLPSSVPAVEVHHVNRISTPMGWQLRLSMFDDAGKPNLIGYCKMHHSRITQIEQEKKKGEVVVSSKDRFNQLNNF